MFRRSLILTTVVAFSISCSEGDRDSVTPLNDPADAANSSRQVLREPEIGTAMLDAIREPDKGEFQSPKAVFDHVLSAIKNQNVDEYIKCCPVRLRMEVFDLDGKIRYTGGYSPQIRQLPGDTYFNLRSVLSQELMFFYQITFIVLYDGAPPEYETFDLDTPEGREKLTSIKEMLDTDRLGQLEIGPISVDEKKGDYVPMHAKMMNVEDFAIVRSTITYREQELKPWASVGKIGDNWRVLNVALDP